MSFSLRSMFGKEASPPPAGSNAAFANEATLGHMPTSLFAEVPAMAGGSATNSGGPLFRTLGEDMEGFSEPTSPFATAPAEEEALTVGDLLPHLPTELARSGAVDASEPVRIAPAILSQALSSGQLAVPLFEVFRVSPGMFQSPVSPDDPRLVSLPPEKLPALIHAAAQAPAVPPASPFHPLPAVNSPAPASPFGQSPFATAQSTPPITPFGSLFAEADPQPPAPMEAARATSLPPRRDPAQPPASSLPPSPFLDTPSPFLETPAAPAAPASPFAAAASPASESAPASPFAGFTLPAMPEAPAPAMGFSLFQEAQEAQPPPAPPAASVFGLPAQPAATPPSPFLDAAPAAAPTNKARMSGPATASVAALLQGQSADALGFDPAMVPTWITTQFHGGTIAELQDQPTPALDLGTIIDGITDIGFRNVLSSAKRDHTVPVPLDKLTPVGSPAPVSSTTVLPASTTPAIANPFLTVAAAPEPPAPVANPFRIEPGNPFAQVPDAPAAAEAPVPEPTPAPAPEPAPSPAAAAPFTVVPKPPGQHFIQPKADIEGMLSGTAPSPAEPAPFTPLPPAKPAPKMIDPFAPAEPAAPATPPSGGFSSFDLLGGAAATESAPAPAAPPLPEPPAAPAAVVLPIEPPAPASTPATAPAAAASPFFAPPAATTPAVEPNEPPPAPVQAAAPAPVVTPAPEPELTDLPEFPAALEVPVVVEKPVFTAPETPADLPFIAAPPAANLETAPKELFRSYGGLPVQDLPFEDVSAAAPEPEPAAAEPVLPVSPPPAMPAATLPPRSSAPAKSALGVSAMESTGEEQLVLRALLDSDEDLDLQRVIDLTTALPGIAACALIRDERVLASSATKSAEAKAFRGQAADVAKNLRALAPLIGINDAETFTLNTDTRLITLCFPGAVTLAVLHDREPSLGQRDKLTLIARQLERLSAQA